MAADEDLTAALPSKPGGSRWHAAGRCLGSRVPELLVFSLGVLLRISMVTNYHYSWNYDSNEHWQEIEWIVAHGSVPNTESTFISFHPPAFYVIAAWLVEHGWTRPDLAYFAVACGILRLSLTWLGLELWLPRQRLARLSALGLSAVLTASVKVDGMIYGEGLSSLIHVLILILTPWALGRDARVRVPCVLLMGVILGFALLIKISSLVSLGALGLGVLYQLVFVEQGWGKRLRLSALWILALSVMIGLSGWYYSQNVRQYGRVFVTSFDLPSQSWLVADARKKDFLDRRSLGFVFGWSNEIYRSPHRPAALRPASRFFPVAMASSVVDYWGYGYAGYTPTQPGVTPQMRSSALTLLEPARVAVIGGTVIFVAMVAAWAVASVEVLRRRDAARLAMLLVPLFMLLAALKFAIEFPVDDYGVVKGAYLMFAAPVLFALFGLSVEWAARRAGRWVLLVALLGSLASLGWYSVVARLTTHFPWEAGASEPG